MLSYQVKTSAQVEKELQDFLLASGDGYSAKEMFGERRNCYAYTFDDVIVMPGHMNFKVEDVSLETNITKKLKLKVPMLSSPMDTVTEHEMAIGMALQGAIGIIHYNMTVEEQANEVRLVKKYKNGFITDPACLSPDNLISDVDKLKEKFGYSGIPITVDGKLGSKLVGIVTNRDLDYVVDRSLCLKDVMTTALVTATEGVSLSEANEVLRRSKKGKLPVVNAAGEIVALISRTGMYNETIQSTTSTTRFMNFHDQLSFTTTDLKKARDFPDASKDQNKQLLVGAAIGTRPNDKERCKALITAGADVIVIDSSQVSLLFATLSRSIRTE